MSDLASIPESLQDVLEELEAGFWVPLLKTPFGSLGELKEKTHEDPIYLQKSLASFHTNLCAARDLLEFPYSLIAPLLPEVENILKRYEKEGNQLDDPSDFLSDRERMLGLVSETLRGSSKHLKPSPHLQRLMHQACLLVWSAIEIFSKEIFIYALNDNPSLYNKITKSPYLKDRFAVGNARWAELLEQHDYNLVGKLGTVVAADKDFSSPKLIRELFPIIFDEPNLIGFPEGIFNSEALMKLGQRRHLIAHKCGIVDDDYLKKSGDTTQKIGQMLNLRGRDIAEALAATASFAILVYGNARKTTSAST